MLAHNDFVDRVLCRPNNKQILTELQRSNVVGKAVVQRWIYDRYDSFDTPFWSDSAPCVFLMLLRYADALVRCGDR
eukprot:260973-Pleurochrysis_carterae.AAC.2